MSAIRAARRSARGTLRWSLNKLRSLVNDSACERLIADRERVALQTSGIEIDIRSLEARVEQQKRGTRRRKALDHHLALTLFPVLMRLGKFAGAGKRVPTLPKEDIYGRDTEPGTRIPRTHLPQRRRAATSGSVSAEPKLGERFG